jgi:hypothetical protein
MRSTMAMLFRTRRLPPAAVPAALLGIVAFSFVVAITDPPGPGLDPDALSYLGAAESLAGHLEYRIPAAPWPSPDSTQPLAHFPPGYPTALALPVRLGMAPAQSARLVQATAAFVTVATLVLLVGAATTTLAGVMAGVALMAMPALYEVHASVLSEPLFLACGALTLAAMAFVPDRPLRAGLAAALGALTRYAGVAFVAAAACWALWPRAPLGTRVRRAAASVLPALLLGGAWVVRTRATRGAGSIRELAFYGALGPTLREGGATLRDWLIPDPHAQDPQTLLESIPHRGWLAVAAGLLLGTLVAIGARAARRAGAPTGASRLLGAATLLAVCYVAVVVASRLAADPNIPFDARILSPLLLFATAILATAIALWWRESGGAARVLVGGALTAWFVGSALVTIGEARAASVWGSDFAGDEWRRSEVLQWARAEGATHPLYSNWPGPVFFYLHRPARYLPELHERAGLAAFVDTLRRRDGRVLAFAVTGTEFVTPDELARQPGLRVVARLSDGLVLAPANAPAVARPNQSTR